MFRRLIGFFLLLFSLQTSSLAQTLPVAPSPVQIRPGPQSGDVPVWQIGPLRLSLPKTWSNTSTDWVARLNGPQNGVATFVLIRATPAASANGYSLLRNRISEVDSFLAGLQWEECLGNPKRTAVSFASGNGHRAYHAKCAVELQPGNRGTYVQAAIFSQTSMLQLHAVGTEQAMDEFLKALSQYGWSEEN